MSTTHSHSDISLNRHAHLRTRSPAGQPSNPTSFSSSPPSSGHLPIREHASHHQPSGERGRTRNRSSHPDFTPPRQHDRYLPDNIKLPDPPSATSSAFTVHDRLYHHPAPQQHHDHHDQHSVQQHHNLGPAPPQDHAPSSHHTYHIDQHYEEHHQAVLPKMPPVLPPPGSTPGSGSGFVSGIEAVANSALTLANNIAFRPLTTAQPAKCSKLKIRIFFDSTIFQAGGNLFGRMEITATSSRSLKLGEIAVELAAYEEITSKEFTATQSFLSSRLCFQGPKMPPSNAVHGQIDENGFWVAKKGKTTFPFAFQLPLDCPSSLVFGQTASLRYVVTGLVQVFYHGKDETILKTKEAFVVEAWDGYNPDYKLPVHASNSTKLFWGGGGNLVLEAMLSERLHSAGGNLTVEVKVSNNTSRKVQGIRLEVARKLEMVADKAKAERNPGLKIDTVSVSEVIGTHEFKSSSYLFDTGEERSMTVNMIVPGNARTIRGTALFEVTCFVTVSMLLGAFSGELSVEIPIKICHPASLTPAPKPQLDHLPHQYNIVTNDTDYDNMDYRTHADGRIASSEDLALSEGNDQNEDGSERPGRQGEWRQDERELSPANSITSIRSILSSPKSKLSKLADKIQRSTSPTSSSHLHHEHRQGRNHDDQDPVGRRFTKSPPLGPAVPLAYVPAVERVRYTPFQPPPTTKAKEFLKAAAQYQQQRAFGTLAGLGDNVEFDLDDKSMATAIHQWISKKETEAVAHSQPVIRAPKASRPTPPIPIPKSPTGRKRPSIDRINTGVGSFTSQYSPTAASPQSPRSPTGFDNQDQQASSQTETVNIQTTARFLHHPHRQPAAPQTGEFGTAPEDSITEVPLFARPLPLPSPPPTGSPHRQEGTRKHAPRSLSPIPIPVQTAESLALAREAYERVKRIGSPVPDLSPASSVPKPGVMDPPRSSSLERDPNIKVPLPQTPVGGDSGGNPSELSRLLNESSPPSHHLQHAPVETGPPPRTCASPELQHVPMNRPLPVPGPKPRYLNQSPQAPSPLPSAPTPLEVAQEPPTPLPATSAQATQPFSGHLQNSTASTQTSSGHLRNPQPSTTSSVQQNSYVPKPTPIPAKRPPMATITAQRARSPNNNKGLDGLTNSTANTAGSAGTKKRDGKPTFSSVTASTSAAAGSSAHGQQGTGSGFVYPKAARKPVPGVKPSISAKPKALTSASHPSPANSKAPSTSPPVASDIEGRSSRPRRDTGDGGGPGQQDEQRAGRRRPTIEDPPLHSNAPIRAPQTAMEALQLQTPAGRQQPLPQPRARNPERERDRRDDKYSRVTTNNQGSGLQSSSTLDTVHEGQQANHGHHHQGGRLNVQGVVEESIQTEDVIVVEEFEAETTSSEIRAQAIAAANSFRAVGANSGGYVVNTGVLRKAINSPKQVQGSSSQERGSGSGYLIQVFAEGAKSAASAAASAAASGLGWGSGSSASTSTASGTKSTGHTNGSGHLASSTAAGAQRPISPPRRQRAAEAGRLPHQHRNLENGNGGVANDKSRREQLDISDQGHDLTMKDIHFQTVSSIHPVATPAPGVVVAQILPLEIEKPRVSALDMESAAQQEQQETKSQHLIAPATTAVAEASTTSVSEVAAVAVAAMTSESTSGSDGSTTETDTATMAVAVTESVVTSASLNLDKTLPKIQEAPPRSRIFERPKKVAPSPPNKKSASPSPTSPSVAPPISSAAAIANRYRERIALSSSPPPGRVAPASSSSTSSSSSSLATGPPPNKAINPKLQAYIQKYNQATNTR
ncbi:hypothetical protein EMPS_03305 [Entomortierella parvispora]|uniref:Arrestin C-terminal-like domain-containing protein n=1 Tax=Entomortierella parvispora TaxID=205924 RepID=A0A9P3H6J1_9FUNG|nr:hypothetical protein EMPS_03305 [Entomortierella parvispora]